MYEFQSIKKFDNLNMVDLEVIQGGNQRLYRHITAGMAGAVEGASACAAATPYVTLACAVGAGVYAGWIDSQMP